MKKRFLVWVLVLALTLPLYAQAASRSLQDIASFSRGGVEEEFTQNSENYRMTAYKALNGNGEWYAHDYAGLLDDFSDFEYLGLYDTGDWVHLCLGAGKGFSFDTFRLKNNDEATPYSAVIVSYRPNNKTIYVRYSNDLTLRDMGYRSSSVPPAASTPGASGQVQDPATYSNGAVRHTDDIPKEGYRQKAYKVLNGNAQGFVTVYGNMLDGLKNLTFLGVYDSGEWTHHCFGAQKGYNYSTFRLKSYNEVLTPYSVVIVSWKEGTNTIYVRYSEDITLTDLGNRY